jgi:hypothetical protein
MGRRSILPLVFHPATRFSLIARRKIQGLRGLIFKYPLGLCTGDDTVFIKHSEASITVLAVKDRVLGHNPLAVIYTSKRFYTRLLPGKPKKG